MENNIALDVESSKRYSILNALDCHRHFSKNSKFISRETEFLTLKICHLESEISDKVVVHE